MHAKLILCLVATQLVACGDSKPNPGSEPVSNSEHGLLGAEVDSTRSFVVAIADDKGIFCTGTLIADDVVLTAGHCGSTRELKYARFGTHADAGEIDIVDTRQHPGYGQAWAENDLQLLRLADKAPVSPAPLLRDTMDNSPTYLGPNYGFVGYGRQAPQQAFGVRRSVFYPISSVGMGTYTYDGQLGLVDRTQIYHHSDVAGPCPGDSGSAVLFGKGGVEHVVGAHSRGSPDCTGLALAARADQPSIEEFIRPTLAEWQSGNPCAADGLCSTGCVETGVLRDPDCAAEHCGSDGVCVAACVSPMDPDCAAAPVDDACADSDCEALCDSASCVKPCGDAGCSAGCADACPPTPSTGNSAGSSTDASCSATGPGQGSLSPLLWLWVLGLLAVRKAKGA